MGQITGTVTAATITDTDVAAGANLDSTKLRHQEMIGTNLGFAHNATPTAREEVVFVATGTGVITRFQALLYDSGTSTNIDFDLKVNGASILSAVVNVVHGTGDRVSVTGTISSGNIVAGDVVSISMAVTSSTGAQGPFAQVVIKNQAPVS